MELTLAIYVVAYVCKEGDGEITASAKFVKERASGRGADGYLFHIDPYFDGFTFTAQQQEILGKMNEYARLYLYGHCDWKSQCMEHKKAEWFAQLFKRMPKINRVSILGCSAARDVTGAKYLLEQSIDSFASRFHGSLAGGSDVWARSYDVKIENDGSRRTLLDAGSAKQKTPTAHRPGSKVKFVWNGRTQLRRFAGKADDTNKSLGQVKYPDLE